MVGDARVIDGVLFVVLWDGGELLPDRLEASKALAPPDVDGATLHGVPVAFGRLDYFVHGKKRRAPSILYGKAETGDVAGFRVRSEK